MQTLTTTKTLPKVTTMVKPSAEQLALWGTYADLDRQPRGPYVARAAEAWKSRRPMRNALAPLVSALLRDGLDSEEVRRCSRRGVDLMNTGGIDAPGMNAFALAMDDLRYEYPPDSEAGRTVGCLKWAAFRVREQARRRARRGTARRRSDARFFAWQRADFAEAA